MESFPIEISPTSFAVALSVNNSLTSTLALIFPEKSAFWQMMFPSTDPEAPTTNLPLEFIDPIKVPSIRKSPFETISPLMVVPAPSKFMEGASDS